jgi:hypothetical protein
MVDMFTKSMINSIAKSIKEGVIIDDRPYREDAGVFPKGEDVWLVTTHPTKYKLGECFIAKGEFTATMKEAKDWARSNKVDQLYLVYEAEDGPVRAYAKEVAKAMVEKYNMHLEDAVDMAFAAISHKVIDVKMEASKAAKLVYDAQKDLEAE